MGLLLFVIGIAGGLLGGMGMGGGTLTIPLLTGLAGVPQHVAQAVNLIAFLPMSAIALLIHARNGLVRPRAVLLLTAVATLAGVLGALIARVVAAQLLRKAFGLFLAVLGVVTLCKEIVTAVRTNRRQTQTNL